MLRSQTRNPDNQPHGQAHKHAFLLSDSLMSHLSKKGNGAKVAHGTCKRLWHATHSPHIRSIRFTTWTSLWLEIFQITLLLTLQSPAEHCFTFFCQKGRSANNQSFRRNRDLSLLLLLRVSLLWFPFKHWATGRQTVLCLFKCAWVPILSEFANLLRGGLK